MPGHTHIGKYETVATATIIRHFFIFFYEIQTFISSLSNIHCYFPCKGIRSKNSFEGGWLPTFNNQKLRENRFFYFSFKYIFSYRKFVLDSDSAIIFYQNVKVFKISIFS